MFLVPVVAGSASVMGLFRGDSELGFDTDGAGGDPSTSLRAGGAGPPKKGENCETNPNFPDGKCAWMSLWERWLEKAELRFCGGFVFSKNGFGRGV